MKEICFTELGYFSENECMAIKDALQGYSYMYFDIKWSNCAGNCTLIVCSRYNATDDEIKQFFIHCALSKIYELKRNNNN